MLECEHDMGWGGVYSQGNDFLFLIPAFRRVASLSDPVNEENISPIRNYSSWMDWFLKKLFHFKKKRSLYIKPRFVNFIIINILFFSRNCNNNYCHCTKHFAFWIQNRCSSLYIQEFYRSKYIIYTTRYISQEILAKRL